MIAVSSKEAKVVKGEKKPKEEPTRTDKTPEKAEKGQKKAD